MNKTFRFYSFLSLLFIALNSEAQITITAADFSFKTQDSVRLIVADQNGVVYPDSGANKVWDYSNLITSTTDNISIGPDVASSDKAGDFPQANVIISRSSHEIFQHLDSTKYESVGVFIKGGTQYVKTYSDNDLMCQFPFTYEDAFTDSLVGVYSISGVVHTEKSEKNSKVVGYGELKLPGKTHPNVLLNRIKVIGQTKKASLTFDDELIEYNFYAPNYNYPVFTIYNWVQKNNGSVTHQQSAALYYDLITHIGIDDFDDVLTLKVYPMPVRDLLQVNGIKEKSQYTLLNAVGVKVKAGILDEANSVIEFGNLPAGNYYLSIQLNGNLANLKVVKL